MAQDLAERLPPDMRARLEQLHATESHLLAQIPTDATTELGTLSAERDALLVEICERLAAMGNEGLREQVLLQLAAGNQRLSTAATSALEAAVRQAADGAHQRRAISAYGEHENLE
jgi:hypothetical protein